MRKLFKLFAFIALSLVLLAVLATATLHREFEGATMWVDDQLITGPLIAIAVMVVVAFVLFIAFLIAIAALASAALFVPLLIGFVLIVAVGALFVGLAPLLIPVLLVVGACVLLARLFKRPRSTPVIESTPHA